jgi:alpha-tubulin suppressor-like RCC1 family protein
VARQRALLSAGMIACAMMLPDCSKQLDVLSYEAFDQPDASSVPDAGSQGCDTCRDGALCSVNRCVALASITWVSAGAEHTCMVKDGTLSCWGSNAASQLGTGDSNGRREPSVVGRDNDWLDVAAAARHSCGLRAPGMLFCWGDNNQGQLGLGGMAGTRLRSSPMRVGTFDDFTKVSCAGESCCALRDGGALYCWGSNTDGNAGVNRTANGPVVAPTQVTANGDFTSVSVGAAHSCAIRGDGTLWCWGRNNDGELGLGSARVAQRQPVRVGSANDWTSVSAGQQHTCGIRRGGLLFCWGGNGSSQVGVGREAPDGVVLVIDQPLEVELTGGWGSVVAGGFHTCARKDRAPDLMCWGRASSGQLGTGSTGELVETPTRVSTSVSLRRFALGNLHTCAFDAERQLYCWGDNVQGQLGFGDTQRRDVPEMLP